MLILIAESKTMAPGTDSVSHNTYIQHRPPFHALADSIMAALNTATPAELSKSVRISLALARRLQQMILEFPDKSTGTEAITAYTGVVFRAFGYPSLDDTQRRRTANRLRIISSLYGYLRPDDIIKPYRFDFNTALAPGGIPFASFWRDAVTDAIIKSLDDTGSTEILDLLPGDAARCIDWQRVGRHATICKADFIQIKPGGTSATPNSNKLKTLRGQLLRHIICDNITDLATLASSSSDHYMADPTLHTPGHLVFVNA